MLNGYIATLILGASAAFAQSQAPGRQFRQKQFDQEFYDGYSVLKHYGGNGPYSTRESYGIGREPPASCEVDQVIMLKRHGERYPDPSTGADFVKSLNKVYASTNKSFTGDLAFLNTWEYYVPPVYNYSLYAQESFSGPYAGLLSNYILGTEYRARYGHLWDKESVIPIFASGYERIIESARKFGEGFFGYNYSTNAALNIIPEDEGQGADSLTPTCVHDNDTAVCDALTGLLPELYVAAARFQAQGVNINASDVYYLMQMAAFELNVRPMSPWIDLFTLDEWAAFGYTQDLSYYYCDGPGDSNMRAVGQVYANATLALLTEGPTSPTKKMFWSFCHDTNITPVVAALGILTPSSPLPTDRVAWGNPWSTGNIVPQSGHLILERLSCNATAVTSAGTYVRVVLNEAVVPFQTCQNGPGYSCPLSNYTALINALPDFDTTCGINATVPQYVTFFWDYNTTTALDYQNGSIAWRESYTNYLGQPVSF